MAAKEFDVVTTFATAAEAEQMVGLLAEEGVPAFVDGAAATTALNHVGSALGGVRLLARVEDVEQARRIIVSLSDDGGGEPWFCTACNEQIEAGFAVCWSCGKPRGEVGGADNQVVEADHAEPAPVPDVPDHDLAEHEQGNPYAAPRTDPATPEPAPGEFDEKVEDLLQRALRAAVIGLFCFPGLAHIFSMTLLLRALLHTQQFSPAGRRRYHLAMLLNLAVLCVSAWLFISGGPF